MEMKMIDLLACILYLTPVPLCKSKLYHSIIPSRFARDHSTPF